MRLSSGALCNKSAQDIPVDHHPGETIHCEIILKFFFLLIASILSSVWLVIYKWFIATQYFLTQNAQTNM